MSTKPVVRLWNLGRRIRYNSALRVQEALVKNIKSCKSDEAPSGTVKENVLLTLEHEPVYTTGIRTKEYSVEEENKLKLLGADFVRTNRGGLITFHGPGQLVVYPILDLTEFVPKSHSRKALLGMKWYVHQLEQVIMDTCHDFGLNASRSPHTGVWIGDNKICAMGVHNSGFITSHGLALNCNNDLSWFDHIVPCGIQDKGVTSLSKELKSNVTCQTAETVVIEKFEKLFACDVDSRKPQAADWILDQEMLKTVGS